MFSLFLSFCFSVSVLRTDVQNAVELMKTGSTFLLALSSLDFEYPTYSRTFIRSAHLSQVNAQFAVVDTSSSENALELLQIKQTPALIYVKDGEILRTQYRGFEDEFVVSFINTNFIEPIKTLKTQEDLTAFYSSTAVGFIVAKSGATEEQYPEILKFHRNNFYDTVTVFADPSLFESEGFYLYRYLDSELVELPDLSTATEVEIAQALNAVSLPEFSRINSYVASDYEQTKQVFAILMLSMDDFYLSQENLDLARAIKEKADINVTYMDIENSAFVGMTYGLPDSLDSTMAVIDASGNRIFKYMLSSELNEKNALELIDQVKQGTATPFWRSELESTPVEGELQTITANSLTQLIKDKKDALIAIYYSSKEPIEPYVNATQPLLKDPKNIIYGRFSLALNDWSGPIVGDELPFLVALRGGKVAYAKKLEDTEEAVAKQIKEALDAKVSDEL